MRSLLKVIKLFIFSLYWAMRYCSVVMLIITAYEGYWVWSMAMAIVSTLLYSCEEKIWNWTEKK
jgi:hypothetical protein